jgi:D-alanine-D-alanine ligase
MKDPHGKPGIAVLAGGTSTEREVSLSSGKAIADALSKMGYPVQFVDVTSQDIPELSQPFDVFFIALHGGFGEDGTLQKIMEERGLVYTGCGAEASRICIDKVAAKQAFIDAHVQTPPYVLVGKELADEELRLAAGVLGMPLVVKPCREGSSVGVSIARDEASFCEGVRKAGKYSEEVLVEKFIEGKELHVAILGCAALPLIEVRPAREFYDYEAKYLKDSGTQYVSDVDLPPMVYDRVQEAVGCRDFARVDVILPQHGKPYVLEVNTIPGFTEKSLLPMAAAAAGIAFPILCEKIVEYALRRAPAMAGAPSSNGSGAQNGSAQNGAAQNGAAHQ